MYPRGYEEQTHNDMVQYQQRTRVSAPTKTNTKKTRTKMATIEEDWEYAVQDGKFIDAYGNEVKTVYEWQEEDDRYDTRWPGVLQHVHQGYLVGTGKFFVSL